jgi:hypothetical protein
MVMTTKDNICCENCTQHDLYTNDMGHEDIVEVGCNNPKCACHIGYEKTIGILTK